MKRYVIRLALCRCKAGVSLPHSRRGFQETRITLSLLSLRPLITGWSFALDSSQHYVFTVYGEQDTVIADAIALDEYGIDA